MHSISFLALVATAVTVSFPCTFSDYVCPQPAQPGFPAFLPSQAFLPQPNFAVQWYYITGVLCAVKAGGRTAKAEMDVHRICLSPLGVQLTTFLYNVSGGSASSPHNEIVASSMIALTYGGKKYSFSTLGLPPIYPNPQQPFDLTFATSPSTSTIRYELVEGVAGQPGSVYNFVATTPDATIDLLLRSDSALMYQGNNGYSGIPGAPICIADYYSSMPRLSTSGVIRLNDEFFFVSGLSWFDHEWGSDIAGIPGAGWIWLGLHLSDGSNLMISIPLASGSAVLTYSKANLLDEDGTALAGVVTSLDVLSNWTSPSTGIIYPTHLKLHTSLAQVREVRVRPMFKDEELYAISPTGEKSYLWEGPMKVEVVTGNSGNADSHRKLKGDGYLELVGFTA